VARHPRYARRLVAFELEKRLFDLRYPRRRDGVAHAIRQIGFRVTDACQLRCHTCGQWGDHGYLRDADLRMRRAAEVTPARYRLLLDDLHTYGHAPVLYFWGGEPMLYRGLLDVIEHGARLGMPPTIATNGAGVAAAAERMIGAPMLCVQISVDGACAETHDAARPDAGGHGGSFAAASEAFDRLTAVRAHERAALPLVVSLTTISRRNYRELPAIYDRFRDVTDLQVYYLSWWIDPASAQAHDAEFRRRFSTPAARPYGWIGDWRTFDYDALAAVLAELRARASAPGATPVFVMPPLASAADLRRYYTDHAATFGFGECISIFQTPEIDSDGSLSPCRDYGDWVVGNVKEHTVTELWNSERYVRFRQSVAREGLLPVCARCCGLMGY
jgi:radical SAM protein with 4Fe4S-binding SPASM domain